MASVDRDLKVKVLVLGDSGVGKSSLTHLLCHGHTTKTPGYTIGCSVEIKLHDFKQGTLDEKTFCVEVWDIGASKSHTSSRFIFYNNVNGIILVHDLTNNKSLQNLPKWLNDVLSLDASSGLASVKVSSSLNSSMQADAENSLSSIPLLLVGTKLDLVSDSSKSASHGKGYSGIFGCAEIQLDTLDPKYVVAGSGNSVKLSRFFDKVVEDAFQRRTTTTSAIQSPVVDRRSSVAGGATERRRNPLHINQLIGVKSE